VRGREGTVAVPCRAVPPEAMIGNQPSVLCHLWSNCHSLCTLQPDLCMIGIEVREGHVTGGGEEVEGGGDECRIFALQYTANGTVNGTNGTVCTLISTKRHTTHEPCLTYHCRLDVLRVSFEF